MYLKKFCIQNTSSIYLIVQPLSITLSMISHVFSENKYDTAAAVMATSPPIPATEIIQDKLTTSTYLLNQKL